MSLTGQTHQHLQAHHGDFERFAERMVLSHAGRFDSVFWAFLSDHAPKEPRTILDFGTGPGLLLADLAKRYSNARVIGVDAQPSMLVRAKEVARQSEARIEILEQDIATAPLRGIADGSVDLAIASMALHELQVPAILIDEAKRILRPGGVWIVYDWIRQPLRSYFDEERPESVDQFTHFSEHCRFTPEDLAWMIENSGFETAEWMLRHEGRHALMSYLRKE